MLLPSLLEVRRQEMRMPQRELVIQVVLQAGRGHAMAQKATHGGKVDVM